MQARIDLTAFDTVLGPVELASCERGVVRCTLPGAAPGSARAWIEKHLPDASVIESSDSDESQGDGSHVEGQHTGGLHAEAIAAVQAYAQGDRTALDAIPLDLRGTPFQQEVWAQLRAIPYGELISYGELARRVGRPGASRACGAANGANPVPLFVPCHRVIASDGTLGGFGGGRALKVRLLQLEGSYAATKG